MTTAHPSDSPRSILQPQTDSRPSRVSLRPAVPGDAGLLRDWRGQPSVRQFQPLGEASLGHLGAELVRQRMSNLYHGQGDKFQWIVRCDEQPAGWLTLVITNWDHGLAEIGYALSTPFQKRGIMVQALHLLLADLFLNSPLERIEARCDTRNYASQRVLQKVGFRQEGCLRGYFVLDDKRVDNYLYAILRSDHLPVEPVESSDS
ncbi:MAG: GNAT family protein [Thermoanaerobaculia bacterium]